jgi:hypothetical protein
VPIQCTSHSYTVVLDPANYIANPDYRHDPATGLPANNNVCSILSFAFYEVEFYEVYFMQIYDHYQSGLLWNQFKYRCLPRWKRQGDIGNVIAGQGGQQFTQQRYTALMQAYEELRDEYIVRAYQEYSQCMMDTTKLPKLTVDLRRISCCLAKRCLMGKIKVFVWDSECQLMIWSWRIVGWDKCRSTLTTYYARFWYKNGARHAGYRCTDLQAKYTRSASGDEASMIARIVDTVDESDENSLDLVKQIACTCPCHLSARDMVRRV